MRRIALMALGFALLLSGVQLNAQAQTKTEKALQAKEQSGWQAWKDQDAKPFEQMIPDKAINIVAGTMMQGKQKVVEGLTNPPCEVKSFSLSDFSYMWLTRSTVLMTYTAHQDATCGAKQIPGEVLASSIWQKKGGQWLSPFHQETIAGGM